ncbi:carboxymuconolactone decarboxylase family protein [Nocardia callitridis]|uniref:Carboxymuconolactone decarboxylase family protein n=1 Tax=Nocardia callitridis TaxID=648753 RepID=A0ABP9KNP1_9NOCA
MTDPARIPPSPRDEWSTELTTFIAEFQSSVRGDRPPEITRPGGAHLLGTLARYPALAKAMLTFNGHLLYESALSARQRELLVLRVAFVRRCAYEWAQHALLAADAGLTQAQIARVTVGPQAAEWDSADRALLVAVDELLADGRVGDRTWALLAAELNERQLMDLVFTVGTYSMLAMALRSFEIQPEDDLRPHLPSW